MCLQDADQSKNQNMNERRVSGSREGGEWPGFSLDPSEDVWASSCCLAMLTRKG